MENETTGHLPDMDGLKLVGGEACLDFTNTLSGRDGGSETEYLHSYGDLLAWAEKAGSIDEETAETLHREARKNPDMAERVLTRARLLREALHRIFVAVSEDRSAAADDMALLNSELGMTMGHVRVEEGGACCVWGWETGSPALDRPLWPVVRSAADLLTSGEVDRVHLCANETCKWLFVDRSRNRSRRWCDMKDCGNVAKVRRYRRRKEE